MVQVADQPIEVFYTGNRNGLNTHGNSLEIENQL
jgi:hypothetical protein